MTFAEIAAADAARLRRDYRELSAAQRLEQAIRLSDQLAALRRSRQ